MSVSCPLREATTWPDVLASKRKDASAWDCAAFKELPGIAARGAVMTPRHGE